MGNKNKLPDEKAQEIINRYIAGEDSKTLIVESGLKRSAFYCLLRGLTYKNLVRPENMKEIIKKQQFKNGRRRKISVEQAQSAIDRYVAGESPRCIGKDLGLTQLAISILIRGEDWKELKRPGNLDEIRKKRSEVRYYRKTHPPLSKEQENIIIGSLLGDGWINKNHGDNQHCSFSKQQIHREHIEWVSEKLRPYSLPKIYERLGQNFCLSQTPTKMQYCVKTTTDPIFTELRKKWYPNGKKEVPTDVVLNPEILAIWYVDDGSTSYKNRACRLHTQGFTFEEAELLCRLLWDNLNIKASIQSAKYKNPKSTRPILQFHGANGYDTLLETIIPFVPWKCFEYKIRHRQLTKRGRISNQKKDELIALRNLGLTNEEIAKRLDIHPTTVCKYYKKGTGGVF